MKINLSLRLVAFIAIFLILAIPQKPIGAADGDGLPTFPDFVAHVMDGHAESVRGVYVPGVLAFPVVQQPTDSPQTVSETEGVVTQFSQAAQHNIIGLLAHNTLAGVYFYSLKIGQEIRIVYGDGRVDYFIVNRLARFKVIQPGSRDVRYKDLRTSRIYNTQNLFSTFYQGNVHVTFQTCIQMGNEPSWGRLFVTAIPVPRLYLRELEALRLTDWQQSPTIIKTLELISGNTNLR